MKEVSILDKKFREMIPESTIGKRISEMAEAINREFEGKEVVFLGILNGAFMFASDLFRKIRLDARISFVKLASYEGTRSSGTVRELIGVNEDISSKHVIIIDDIIDAGHTLESIVEELSRRKVASVKVAALLFKPAAYQKKIPIDYTGFEIPNDFVVGYGLDYEGLGRNLTSIYTLIKESVMVNFLIFGPPGSGKGTQSVRLAEKFNLAHLSTGDMLRAEIAAGTELGKKMSSIMSKGELVPDEVVIEMIAARIDGTKGKDGFLFDGFPRTVDQTVALEKMLNKRKMKIDSMLVLDVDHDELVKRLIGRAELSGRPDDKDPAVIENRIDVYKEKTEPIIEYCRKKGIYKPINGMGSIEDIFVRLSDYMKKFL